MTGNALTITNCAIRLTCLVASSMQGFAGIGCAKAVCVKQNMPPKICPYRCHVSYRLFGSEKGNFLGNVSRYSEICLPPNKLNYTLIYNAFIMVNKFVIQQAALSPFSTRRICSRDAKRKQESGNVIG